MFILLRICRLERDILDEILSCTMFSEFVCFFLYILTSLQSDYMILYLVYVILNDTLYKIILLLVKLKLYSEDGVPKSYK